MQNNHFKIIVPFFNVQKWIEKSLESILLQNYSNYECIIIDDSSTDRSFELAENLVKKNKKFKLIRNSKNIGSLKNTYKGIIEYSTNLKNDDIIAILDGDDFFYAKDSLYKLNSFYSKSKCWMTYGSYITLSNKKRGKHAKRVPNYVVENNFFREYKWSTSALRSYKAFLVKKLDVKDLMDEKGFFFKSSGDLAMMFPLLEMSGHKAHFVREVLYVANDLNSLNDDKVNRKLQLDCENKIRNKIKYARLPNRQIDRAYLDPKTLRPNRKYFKSFNFRYKVLIEKMNYAISYIKRRDLFKRTIKK